MGVSSCSNVMVEPTSSPSSAAWSASCAPTSTNMSLILITFLRSSGSSIWGVWSRSHLERNPFPHGRRRAVKEGSGQPATEGGEAQVAVVINILDDQADLIHMCSHHHTWPVSSSDAYDVAPGVHFHVINQGGELFSYQPGDILLMAGNSMCLCESCKQPLQLFHHRVLLSRVQFVSRGIRE